MTTDANGNINNTDDDDGINGNVEVSATEPVPANPSEVAFGDLSPDLIIDAIESHGYLCDGRLLALNSYENRVYRIGLEEQPPIIAKFYRPGRWSDTQISEEHEFARELAKNEIPVVAPEPDASGASLREHCGYRFALYPMRSGRSPELDNPEQLQIIGRFIGRLHLAGETSSFEHRGALDAESLGRIPSSYLLENNRLPGELTGAYESVIDDLIAKITDRLADYPNTRQIRLHGDFHPGNILWRDDTPHIVDLDDAKSGPSVQDLWLFLSGDRHYQQARLADLLDGYTMFRQFDSSELGLIESLRTLRIIHYAAWLDQRRSEPAFQQAFPWTDSSRYWDDHILELKEQSSALDEPPLRWD